MQKSIGFCVLMAFLSMPVVFLASTPSSLSSDAAFVGQDKAEVGELCRFLAEGEIVRWECLPPTADSESYGQFNENYVVSFRVPGNYTVIAAVYKANELTIHTQPVSVAGGVVHVDPTIPVATEINQELSAKVVGWVTKYSVPKETCTKLASNFSQVARLTQEGHLKTAEEVISKTVELNKSVEVNEDLMAELQAYLTSQSDVGNLKTPEQHAIAWNSIAKGLSDASK